MTFLLETIRLGLSNLKLHLLRSILTALGIILGVAAVIIMVSLGEGTKREALARIERLGARNIIIRSQKPPESTDQNQQNKQQQQGSFIARYGITREDLGVLKENFPDADNIVPLKEVGARILRGERKLTSQAFGTTPELPNVANFKISKGGRYLTPVDMENKSMVAVVGSQIGKIFFPLEDPVGQTFRIDEQVFTVVGVMEPIGLAGGAGAALVGRDLNLDVHIPLTTARNVFDDTVMRFQTGSRQITEVQLSEIYVSSPDRDRVLLDAKRIDRIMKARHTAQPDFSIFVPYELLETARKQALTFNIVFGAVAGISLLVGGIGIMNIMLATVTERTREIGIRRAIGATRRHILWQFLVETGVLSAIGGLAGVAIGVGGSVLLGWVVPKLPKAPYIGKFFDATLTLPTHVAAWSIFVAFGVAAATGLVFGIYPARKAAKQDPIVALRHD